MNRHILSLNIVETNNPTVLKIQDLSVYSDLLKVDCGRLEILPPGFDTMWEMDTVKGFDYNLTACTLGVQKVDCDTQVLPLPDGIYTIRYSVSPNCDVFVEYKHLRITNALSAYYICLQNLEMGSNDNPTTKSGQLITELQKVKTYLEAAQKKVQDEDSPNAGIKVFNYAVRQLNSICNSKPSCDIC